MVRRYAVTLTYARCLRLFVSLCCIVRLSVIALEAPRQPRGHVSCDGILLMSIQGHTIQYNINSLA